mmetsp:Transcript_31517/g.106118  ORF Transcript_31517/g.106118 Transcript_31517/m.106118 type:complete len:212 (+) Transcript_31517:151-786(+)
MVSSMMALTMSPSFDLSAATALGLLHEACDMTSSMSLGSRPVSSAPSAPSSSATALGAACCWDGADGWNCCAACDCACAERSSIFASPKMTYVSELGDLKTSGLEMAKRMFFDFFTVTRMMSGTAFMPSFCMALRFFFSARFCLPPLESSPPASPSSSRSGISSSPSSSSGISSSESSSSGTSSSSLFAIDAIVQWLGGTGDRLRSTRLAI